MYISLHVKYPLFLFDFMELDFFGQIFEKNSNIKFHKNPSKMSRVFICGHTAGHDEGNSRFAQFCENA
jgi:hypothetical protein